MTCSYLLVFFPIIRNDDLSFNSFSDTLSLLTGLLFFSPMYSIFIFFKTTTENSFLLRNIGYNTVD
ncbi:WSSV289 [White spot syndrome virus]|uniref:WSSV289 n=1 Tax=White spot syndrome virus TaxID=92652 RepID=Q8QTD5_WSSV|nr:WSSV289 [Shrimp white spot syndrome virus]